jgi:hypothetical protein
MHQYNFVLVAQYGMLQLTVIRPVLSSMIRLPTRM